MLLEMRKNQQEHEEVERDEDLHPNEKEDESAHGHESARDREVTTIWRLHPNDKVTKMRKWNYTPASTPIGQVVALQGKHFLRIRSTIRLHHRP